MKLMTSILLAATLLIGGDSAQAETSSMPLDYHFICTSNTPKDAASEIAVIIEEHLLDPEGAPSGSEITLYDSSVPSIKTQFTIEPLRYDSSRARKINLRKQLKKIDSFFDSCSVDDPSKAWTGKIPETLDLITNAGSNTRIIYLVSPVYQDTDQPEFSFVRDDTWTVPNTSVVQQNASTEPFGLVGKVPLKGSTHIVYPENQKFENGRYKLRLEAFYRYYFSKLGSKLCDFQVNLEQVLSNLKNPVEVERIDVVIPDDALAQIDMREAQDSSAGGGNSDALAKALMKMLSADTTKGEVSIAIGSDQQGVDFDLCVWVGEEEPLYFGNRSSSSGRYLKDLRTPEKHQFEEVVLNARPETVEAFVNLHSVPEGFNENAEGRCLILVDNVVYTSNFNFTVHRGDNGQYINKRESSPFWCKLDVSMIPLPEIKKLKDLLH